MRAVIQRVKKASVKVNGELISQISQGLLIFLGISKKDKEEDIKILADKIADLRIFSDENGKMNLSIKEVNGDILVVSQFTLFADCRRGKRPDFTDAADKEKALDYYKKFVAYLKNKSEKVEEGIFQAYMEVELINDGPVTIILDTEDLKKPRRRKE
ncbi:MULTISPECIES: D-aminoacyl-tRNA deacylase [Dictyoglomus]|jgi:D-tyrosyl-tRNA(Tyr) deacylase|uniref:D-aminoacyl-tRNA deacylase n=1 Tax=Dictyoglomus turgidum (strain DSM 6724 / Z-1310) TaxID=515635 RepID=DTD_DICTD|nr:MULTISPECIES: D-aminoacyl-tRNA deacylase [Dictyoglomus]B8E1C2.1 RecName: Full=D-aminoacyl-tRNA deacylase; Short=DTD; AltName: Full=Gly-tRNA(Ala) deacylase [Dictyoglomus turgidum DSM 6724]ACK42250.1 D-tyrosyl-tRNA(Tyr) deacylase [Dictyoglomus turgidum DSM 6724]PNV80565.1 MAG: D-aminoacyl-tRNA deacylase [Dictyoglomus turgidum]HBU32481.1 D-aminoacyl-tRNA deacylase [Dictyoglomus sp.]